MIKVSIILPLYNSELFIKECLDSLFNQSFNDYELIILDDCSTDKTTEILDKRMIKYYKNEANLGFVKNLNKGIKIAKGDYIMIADHDIVYDKDYLKEMMSKEKDVMNGRSYYYKEKNKIRAFGIMVNLLTGKTNVIGRDQIDNGEYDLITEVPSAAAGTLVIHKKVFDKIGLFDESFDKYYADADFGYRAEKAGFKMFLSKAKCWHKKEEKESFNKNQLKSYYLDKKLFLKKHSPYYPISLIPIKLKNLVSR